MRSLNFSVNLNLAALGSTQPLTEINIKNLLEGKGWPTRETDNFTAIFEPIV
jgi:hypothetical protein